MSEQGAEQEVSQIRHTSIEAARYDQLYERMQNMSPDTRGKYETAFILISLSLGLPTVVTQEGTLVTPLNVWARLRERHHFRPDDQVKEEHLMELLGRAGIRSTALPQTGPIQKWTKEIAQIQNILR